MSGKKDKKRRKAKERDAKGRDAKERDRELTPAKEQAEAQDGGAAKGRVKSPKRSRPSRSRKKAAETEPTSSQRPLEPDASELAVGELADVDAEEAFELGIGSRVLPPHFGWSDPLDAPAPQPAVSGDVAEQIRALEARLDGLIRGTRPSAETPSRPTNERPVELAEVPAANGAAEDLSQSPYFEKQWGREARRNRAEEVDDFGLDPAFEERIRPVSEFLLRRYFRTKIEGINNVPANGRCLLVSNHSGTLPLDGLMLRTALRLEHPSARELRWLAEDFLFYLPFAGVFMNRVGAVRACQENAERLLEKELIVAAFPEGVQGIKKLFRERYRLQRFGRGGYIRLALRMQAPLVPCAIVGAEETNPLLYRVEYLASLVGLPYIPVTPTFPLLGPLGLLPAPSRWRIRFGEPISLDGHGPEAADDHVLVGRLSDRVRATIQGMLESGVRDRRSVWFG
ncbi:MAG TPA: 1-acyl-sn-glycerol-3-phosphate acyltransferase [Polyangiaceae bacterium]